MSGPIDKFLAILHLVNNSDKPLTTEQIKKQTDINIRTVQRHTTRLVKEGFIDFQSKADGSGYLFMKLGAKA